MKLTKYLAIACAGLILTACNDNDWNTSGDVSVEMAEASIRIKENVGIFNVPLKVTGKTNGAIQVTVNVAEASSSPAVEDVHYLVTSKTVTIPADSIQVGIEVYVTNDMEINDDRSFVVSIASVEGAAIGNRTSTEVTIRDDDSLFYDAIQGTWAFKSESLYEGNQNWTVKISGVEEGEDGYEKTLYLSGLKGYSWVTAELEYNYDEITNTITLSFPYDQIVATDVEFQGLGLCDVGLYGLIGGYLDDEGALVGTVSSDLKSISFPKDSDVIFYVLQNGEGMGAWDRIMNISMSR